MLTSLNFTSSQTAIYNYEFCCRYPPWYLSKYIAKQGNVCSFARERSLRQFWKKNDEQFASITPDFHRALSCGLLQLRLIVSCGWIRVAAVSNSDGWIRLSWFHPAADYKLPLILFCGWLEFTGWTRLVADLLYFNILSKFKDFFCKLNHFYGLFSADWFQSPLNKALATASRTLKKLEEVSRP